MAQRPVALPHSALDHGGRDEYWAGDDSTVQQHPVYPAIWKNFHPKSLPRRTARGIPIGLVDGRVGEHIAHGPRLPSQQLAEQRVDPREEPSSAAWYMPSRKRAVNSCSRRRPARRPTRPASDRELDRRPVSSDAMSAISSNVGAALAVRVVGPSKAPFEARMTAAASAASSRAVQDTGPSAGTR